jgi:nicotinamidase-related amidase
MDTHYFDYIKTKEGKKLPVEHCLINTDGWRIEDSIYQAVLEKANQGCEIKYICKNTFGSVDPVYNEDTESTSTLKDAILNLEKNNTFQHIKNNGYIDYIPMEIEMCGFCTDICVVSNALILKAYTYNFAEITVDSKCCAGVTPEKHEAALEVMRSCQINVI